MLYHFLGLAYIQVAGSAQIADREGLRKVSGQLLVLHDTKSSGRVHDHLWLLRLLRSCLFPGINGEKKTEHVHYHSPHLKVAKSYDLELS